MSALGRVWAQVMAPGDGGTGYGWAVMACGHLMLGAALSGALGLAAGAILVRLAIMVAYWLVKESGDLRRGGTIRDGLSDAALVGAGLFYGPAWWPVLAFGAICAGAVLKEAGRG